MSKTLQAVRGMNDLLPQDASVWQFFEDTTREVFEQYGYRLMRAPVVEPTALFVRSIGEVTDIVEKEMYSFEDSMNGEKLTLRPKATAGLAGGIEHNLLYDGPKRIWTSGRCFAMSGRRKAVIGSSTSLTLRCSVCRPGRGCRADPDARPPVAASRFKGAELHINSIGDAAARKLHRRRWSAILRRTLTASTKMASDGFITQSVADARYQNPRMQQLVEGAPRLADISVRSSASILTASGNVSTMRTAFHVPRLVRAALITTNVRFSNSSPKAATGNDHCRWWPL
jgi:histidyl-tRNA synthetase